ncbi:MAG TPA: L,D-transpeptidase family protein, partial [Caulobacteraceae bacterium]|nr:L,D-transpeptidase family protein [Caulobacteraceae bacterium]
VAALASPSADVRAEGEKLIDLAAVGLARAQHGGRIDPASVSHEWALRQDYDARADYGAARAAGTVAAWARALAPDSVTYQRFAAARARYAAIVADGGWAPIGAGKDLKIGDDDPRIAALRVRLAVEGYAVAASDTPTVLDEALSKTLTAFQTAHGIKATGKLDAATVKELDVPADVRLAVIDLNLERERWLPRPLPADRIEVDIGGQVATVYQAGQVVLDMRIIVGQPTKRTPSFASHVTAVVFNPPWVVPSSIAAAELYPKERRHPGYFARNGFHIQGGQLVQAPGPKAALGYIKFDLVSPFGVYLHDTPSRSLFARDRRTLSHGCMRLQSPRELAALLLAHQGWSRDDVEAAIAAGATRRVGLEAQTPVFVVYRTVAVAADGTTAFRPDVYGWDAMLAAALAGR